MKKLLLIIAMLGTLLTSLNAQEQIEDTKAEDTKVEEANFEEAKVERRKNRIEGGMNFTTHEGMIDDLRGKFEEKIGYHLGLYREYQLKNNFYLLYGAEFRLSRFRGQEIPPNSTKAVLKEDMTEKTIIAPLRVGYSFNLKHSAIELEFGAYYGRVLSSKLKIRNLNPDYKELAAALPKDLIEAGIRNRNEFGLTSRLSYVYNDRFVIFIESSKSINNTFHSINPEHTMLLSNVESILGIGIRF